MAVRRLKWGGYEWKLFSGTGYLGQDWSPDHVLVQPDGKLVILNSNGVSGGIGMVDGDQVYGKWTVRFRMTRGCGKYCCVLWPDNGMRPEIDFAEDTKFDSERKLVTATLHPDMNNRNNIHSKRLGNFTLPHDHTVEWRKDFLRFSIDGQQWFEIKEQIPTDRHHLNIQTAIFAPGPASKMIIEKVTIEK